MRLHYRRVLFLLGALVAAAACAGNETQPTATPTTAPVATPPAMSTAPPAAATSSPAVAGNLFVNPSFEEGDQPWFSMSTAAWGTPFQVSDAVAHSGSHSAYLEMRAGPEATGPKVFGVVQEVSPAQFPEVLSGYYRVQNWVRGTEKQYLQFVIIVFGATNLPSGYANHQIRYPLAGIDKQPFEISNAHFIFVGTEEPVTDHWVYFERNISDDFKKLWGAVPEGFQMIRIFFEVRYDDKQAGSGEVNADAFYDDLYVGSAADNPNRPEP
jgi:hypothetical protein